jgi:hypothetical protein
LLIFNVRNIYTGILMTFSAKELLFAPMVILTLGVFTSSAKGQTIDVTADGTPILGLANSAAYIATGNAANDNGDPNEYNYSTNGYTNVRGNTNTGVQAMVDNDPSTYADTEYDGDLAPPLNQHFDSAFVGEIGLGTVSATTPITAIQLNFTLNLYEGSSGFFGDNGTGDTYQNSPGGDYFIHLPALTPYQVQVYNGTTWTTVASTSNYYALLNNYDVGSAPNIVQNSPTITFTLSDPVDGDNIDGIRVIGTYAGPRSGGPLAINTLVVEAPEPSTYALLGLGMAGLLACGSIRRRTCRA